MINNGLFLHQRDDWETPQKLFDDLNKEFSFTLDVAANDVNHKCPKYYTKETDGLLQDWRGCVFCNPPYGSQIKQWVKKAYEQNKSYGTTVVMLLPARTDTKWFHDYIYKKAEVRFLQGRLRFVGAQNNAPFPSMIVVFNGTTDTVVECDFDYTSRNQCYSYFYNNSSSEKG